MLTNTAALVSNRLSRSGGVRLLEGRKITISGPAGEPIQADGDLLGQLPLRIEASTQPLMVIAAN